jgi:hypothetical protein
MSDIEKILEHGISFSGLSAAKDEKKVKTKAKKKAYITGQHFSGSAKMKADIRKQRANRRSQRKG